jgi:hypothetical protein
MKKIKVRKPTEKGDETVLMSVPEIEEKVEAGWVVVDPLNGELVEKYSELEEVTIFPPISGG